MQTYVRSFVCVWVCLSALDLEAEVRCEKGTVVVAVTERESIIKSESVTKRKSVTIIKCATKRESVTERESGTKRESLMKREGLIYIQCHAKVKERL